MYEQSEKKEYKLAPEGKYNFTIEDIKEKESTKGGWFLSVRFKIIDGDYEGTSVFETIFKSFPKNPKVLHFSKIREDDIKRALNVENDCPLQTCVGRKIIGDVEQQVGTDGVTRNKITSYESYTEEAATFGEDSLSDEDIPF